MGRKAKKRVKVPHVVPHEMERLADSDSHVDIIGDHEDHMLEFKRLKENGSIDMMLDDLEQPEHDTLSMPDELGVDDENSVDVLGDSAYDSKVTDSVSEPEPCHSDSDIIKSDIFDPAYEMHQNLVSSMGEYGAAFLNGMDHEGMLDVKHDPPPLPSIALPPPPQPSVSLESASALPPVALIQQQQPAAESLRAVCSSQGEPDHSNLVSNMVSRPETMHSNGIAPEDLVGSLPPTSLGGDTSLEVRQQSSSSLGEMVNTISAAIPSVIPGAIPISPLFLPSTVAGLNPATAAVNATSTALAHISKIEPGADGKGYVLHLTIPALGLGNVMLSTEGLTFAHPDPKMGSPGSATAANMPCSPSDNTGDNGSYSPCMDDTGSPDEVNINVDTDSPSPMSYPSDDNPVGDPASDLGLGGSELQGKAGSDGMGEDEEEEEEGMEGEVFSGGAFINSGGQVSAAESVESNHLHHHHHHHHHHHSEDTATADNHHILGTVVTAAAASTAEQSITTLRGAVCHQSQAAAAAAQGIATGSEPPRAASSATKVASSPSPDISGNSSSSPPHMDLDSAADLKLTAVVEHNSVDKPEVDRFVICSDGPMVCVLCAFKTDSYSAFKSHIICSHPCWRITKKLSKNRLLVEKSVKMNTSLVHTNFNMPPSICNRKAGDVGSRGCDLGTTAAGVGTSNVTNSSSSTTSTTTASSSAAASTTTTTTSSEKPRKSSMHPRKKQLIERNKRLFRCTKCLRLFVFEGSIVNHLMDYHGIKKPYEHIMVSNDHGQSFGNIHRCAHKNCFVTCTSELELEKHRLESHAQVVFRCQICGYTADNADAIKAHAVRIHHQQICDYAPSD